MDWKTLLNPDRRRKSTITGDHRAEFERDFDRAVFSTPVKRLQDKAQVFPLEPHDAVRTRLTHSLEVSSVARGLGRKAAGWLLEQHVIEPGMDRSIEAIAATCGLIHDLGTQSGWPRFFPRGRTSCSTRLPVCPAHVLKSDSPRSSYDWDDRRLGIIDDENGALRHAVVGVALAATVDA